MTALVPLKKAVDHFKLSYSKHQLPKMYKMRKILLLLIAFLPIIVNAQTEKSDLTLNNGTQDNQVKVMMRNGAVIMGNLKEFDPLDHITLIIAGVESKIPMSEVAYVDQKGSTDTNIANSENTIVNPKINHSAKDYKGFLMEKGNNVYVFCDNDKYGKKGADRLRSLLIQDGFWNVVDRMENAHFTINYGVTLRRGDKLLLSVSSWRTNELVYLAILRKLGVEDDDNHERYYAQELYDDYIVPFQKKIVNGKLAKSIVKKFTVE